MLRQFNFITRVCYVGIEMKKKVNYFLSKTRFLQESFMCLPAI